MQMYTVIAETHISLGGTTESQREFLEALSVDETRKPQDRQNTKQPPIANNFALGYTYQDVLDADHEGKTHASLFPCYTETC